MYYFSNPSQEFTKYFNKNTQKNRYFSKTLNGSQKPHMPNMNHDNNKMKYSPLEKGSKSY